MAPPGSSSGVSSLAYDGEGSATAPVIRHIDFTKPHASATMPSKPPASQAQARQASSSAAVTAPSSEAAVEHQDEQEAVVEFTTSFTPPSPGP